MCRSHPTLPGQISVLLTAFYSVVNFVYLCIAKIRFWIILPDTFSIFLDDRDGSYTCFLWGEDILLATSDGICESFQGLWKNLLNTAVESPLRWCLGFLPSLPSTQGLVASYRHPLTLDGLRGLLRFSACSYSLPLIHLFALNLEVILPFVELGNDWVTLGSWLVRNIIGVNTLFDDELEVTQSQDGNGHRDD